MAEFTATIPGRPTDAPADVYPGESAVAWRPFFRRVLRDEIRRGRRVSEFQQFDVVARTVTEAVTLVVSGAEPTAWEQAATTATTIAGVKVDYTTWARRYDSLVFQKFTRYRLTMSFRFSSLPPSRESDFERTVVWFVPAGEPMTERSYVEKRTKLASWGAGLTIGAGGGQIVELGVELDFSHEGQDLTPPSRHPAPKMSGLERDEQPDESLEDRLRSAALLPLGQLFQPSDAQPLTADELAVARSITPVMLNHLTLDDFAVAVDTGEYPGFVRFLLAQMRRPTVELAPAEFRSTDTDATERERELELREGVSRG
jgi:hypothetical protein